MATTDDQEERRADLLALLHAELTRVEEQLALVLKLIAELGKLGWTAEK